MDNSGENVNLGNPANNRRDAVEDKSPKVTNADHPHPAGRGADDLFDDTMAGPDVARASFPTPVTTVAAPPTPDASAVTPVVPIASRPRRTEEGRVFDIHAETIRDPSIEMVGEATSHRDPLSGESGTHPVGVGVGAGVGGAAIGAATGFVAGAMAGPLGAAFGAAAGTVIGAIAGGYAGKGIAEAVNPTTEDHYWRAVFSSRPYVPKGAKFEEYEPAYAYGIQMRDRLIDQTWEEAEPVIRTGWEESEYGLVMRWDRARPAVLDAWDHLTPEPEEPETSEEERAEDE